MASAEPVQRISWLQEIEKLQKEIQHLNDTVFSKTFKAPSAWADRELKYKMEKRSWEVELQGFKEQVKTLQEENEGYRAANRAAEFEQNIQVVCFSSQALSCMSAKESRSKQYPCTCLFMEAIAAYNRAKTSHYLIIPSLTLANATPELA